MRFNKLEFGKKGPEGLKGEGVDETKGYGSLRQYVPFAGEDMAEQADKINAILESIDLPEESESGQDIQPKADVNIGNIEQKSENIQDDTQKQIESLKANLHSIFENSSYPATYDNKESETDQTPQPEKIDDEKDQIEKELAEAKAQLAKTLEWAKQQPNEPEKTFSGNLENLPDGVKRRIMERMEAMQQGDVMISNIDNIYQEGNYIVVDAKDNQGRFTGAEFAVDDFAKLVNNQSQEQSSSLMEQSDDSKEQSQDSPEQDKNQPQPESVAQEQKLQEKPIEQEKPLAPEADSPVEADESSSKNETINRIVSKMLDAGEFQNYGLDISQKMRDIEYAKKKLQDKTLEELQILLSTYE